MTADNTEAAESLIAAVPTNPEADAATARRVGEADASANIATLLDDLDLGAQDLSAFVEAPDALNILIETVLSQIEHETAVATPAGQDSGVEIVCVGPPLRLDAPNGMAPKPLTLSEQMRAMRHKLNGGEEDDGDDPLAKEKRKTARTLKKYGRTLAHLPADWDKLPRTAREPGARSRQNELYKVIREAEDEMRETERQRELEKRGRPANYDGLPPDAKRQINDRIRQQRYRDRKRELPSKAPVAPLPIARVAPDALRSHLAYMLRSLTDWSAHSATPLARQLRKRDHQLALVKAAAAYSRYFNLHGEPPTHVMLGLGLRCSKDQARRKLDVLKALYAPGGPWDRA